MGSIILCHKKRAKQPYEISRINRRIYTMEELCYYLCNHLYLVDYTIMNDSLCDWLQDELELIELAEDLRKSIAQNGSAEQFVLTILANSSIYTTAELNRIQSILDQLKNQKPIEKQKYKADNLLKSGATQQAVLIYLSIIHGESEEAETVEPKFYGKVYGCLGTAYGRLFLYEEAAEMFEAAYQICEEESMLKAYLYACRRYMTREEYQRLLAKSQVYQKLEVNICEEIKEIRKQTKFSLEDDTLDKWKEQYRRMGIEEK